MKSLLPKTIANMISNHQLSNYLHSKGWINDNKLGEKAKIWHRPEEKNFDQEVIEPISENIKNHSQKIWEALEAIANFENRTPLEIAESIKNFSTDLISIRVKHHDVSDGTIPLDDGVLLIEKSKDLLIAATLSTYKKDRSFSGNRPESVQKFISGMRLGQTDIGSYIVNLIAPIEKPNEKQEDINQSSISRTVTTTLSTALNAVKRAINLYQEDCKVAHFENAITYGVSANLCDALIGISGRSKSRDFEISIKLGSIESPAQEIKLDYNFYSKSIATIETASAYYKGNYQIEEFTAQGFITKMKHLKGENSGEITILSKIANSERNIKTKLSLENYWKAVRAHEKELLVSCTGMLRVNSKSAELFNPKEFKTIETLDMFD